MKKNFYKVLGIPNRADLKSIKKAYRKAAKKFHPDISPKNEERFKEIQEAYETLSNPEKRAIYDQEEFRKPGMGVEQFTPRSFTSMASPFHLFEQMEEIFSYLNHSWIDEIHHFFYEGEEDQHVFSVEITLSPEQARRGCEIPLKIPIWINCRRCHGTGYTKGLICGLCRGRGQEKLEKQIKISIPSGVKDGMRITIPIDDKNFDLSYIEANLKINR